MLEFVDGGCYGFGRHFATSDSINQLKLFFSKSDISLIELISNSSPPIFIFRFLYELSNHVTLFLVSDLLQILIIAKMFELIIPSIRNPSNFDLGQLVLLIQRVVSSILILDEVYFLALLLLPSDFGLIIFTNNNYIIYT
jgi:hypothetical protein